MNKLIKIRNEKSKFYIEFLFLWIWKLYKNDKNLNYNFTHMFQASFFTTFQKSSGIL